MKVFSEAHHISVTIARSPAEVYARAREPSNLPLWAKGLSGTIEFIDGDWIADSPMGKVKVRFVEQNPFGVLDHDVVLPSGESVYNPMRVVAKVFEVDEDEVDDDDDDEDEDDDDDEDEDDGSDELHYGPSR